MAQSFIWLKTIPQTQKDLVFGFVKDVEKLLQTTNVYYIISSLVCYKILEFYYLREIFGNHGHMITLEESDLIASMNGKTSFSSQTIIGTVIIDVHGSCIYKWKFKIIEMSLKLAIGIVDRDQIKDDAFFAGDFTWQSVDFAAYHYEGRFEISFNEWSSTECEDYGEGDIIEMKINTTDLTIEYAKNGKWFGALKDADAITRYINNSKEYQLAVMMSGVCKIVLVDFEQKIVD